MSSVGRLLSAAVMSLAVAAGATAAPQQPAAKPTLSVTEPKPFTDPFMQTMTLVSGINGSTYEVRVGLPYSYGQGNKSYPVFVVLDGEALFLSAAEITRNASAASSGPLSHRTSPIPEFIVIGITLPSVPFDMFRRNFEFMPPTSREEMGPSMRSFIDQAEATYGGKARFGGAEAFRNVLDQEILPAVAKRYRVDPSRRMLFGHSAGGAFAAYTLLTKPDLFTDYIIASPGLMPGNFRLEEAWAKGHSDLRARVLLTSGEKEMLDPLEIASGTARLSEALANRKYPGLTLQTWIVPDAAHAQTPVPSIVHGLNGLSPP
jgi:predicted alpha/beta superfamily hydrolase